jgi:hypothetical protein
MLTCHSIIVCSNRGPLIAFSLGCWLGDHFVARFGACICRRFSPSSGSSCRGASRAPPASSSRALVPDTFCGTGLAEVSLACILSSPEKRRGAAMKARVEGRTILLTAEAAPDLADTIIVSREVRCQHLFVGSASSESSAADRVWKPIMPSLMLDGY